MYLPSFLVARIRVTSLTMEVFGLSIFAAAYPTVFLPSGLVGSTCSSVSACLSSATTLGVSFSSFVSNTGVVLSSETLLLVSDSEMLNSDFLIVSGFASSPVSFGLPKETSGVLTCTTSVDFPISVFVEATVTSDFSVTRLDGATAFASVT